MFGLNLDHFENILPSLRLLNFYSLMNENKSVNLSASNIATLEACNSLLLTSPGICYVLCYNNHINHLMINLG